MLAFMRNYLELSQDDLVAQRPEGADQDDVHFTEALAAAILTEYTEPGDTVLDPFAGYGTTLVVAQRMGLAAVGIELLPRRVRIIRDRVADRARVIEGDARRLGGYGVGPVDLCLTSPPYMTAADHPENPLTGYTTLDGNYQTYLAELGEVFATVAGLLNPGGHLVINVANLSTGGIVTPLAWDLAAVVSRRMSFRGEIYLRWDRPQPGITGDYCLVFRGDAEPAA
jgi:DNA modification methylase